MINKKWQVFAIIFILLIGIYLSLRLNAPLNNSEQKGEQANVEHISNEKNPGQVKKQGFIFNGQRL